MDPSEYAWMSATDLVKALQSKQLSPVDLIDAAIARIEQRNPAINAVVSVVPMSLRSGCRRASRWIFWLAARKARRIARST